MIFKIGNVDVFFPYDLVFPEQLKYMAEIKNALESNGHYVVEITYGAGKTEALLSILVSYQLYLKSKQEQCPKMVYCLRTPTEIQRSLVVLRHLYVYVKNVSNSCFVVTEYTPPESICAEKVSLLDDRPDTAAHKTSSRLRTSMCCNHCKNASNLQIPFGVYAKCDIQRIAHENGMNPCSVARKLELCSDFIVCTYSHMIDPRINDIVLRNVSNDSVIIFDEAHSIESTCVESFSVDIQRGTLDSAARALRKIEERIAFIKAEQHDVLAGEYIRMKDKITRKDGECISYLYNSGNYDYVPGNIRHATHFVSVLKRLNEFFKTKLKSTQVTTESPTLFCQNIKELTFIDRKTLSFTSQRLQILMQTIFLEEDAESGSLRKVAEFATLASLKDTGFSIIFEPFESKSSSAFNPVLRLCCFDSSLAMKQVCSRFRKLLITGGTLGQLDMYSRMLGLEAVNSIEICSSLVRSSVCPLIVTKGNDQMTLRAQPDLDREGGGTETGPGECEAPLFSLRSEPAVTRNYGTLVLELSRIVPDGMVVFFPSYAYMEEIVSLWSESMFIAEIMKHKLVFIETPDLSEIGSVIAGYKRACDCGRGGALFLAASSSLCTSIELHDNHCRCAVMLGVPFPNIENITTRKKFEFLQQTHGISMHDFLNFYAMKQAAYCLSYAFRNKKDYGLMILADKRFEDAEKIRRLPRWMQDCIDAGNTNLSVDMAVNIGKRFFREIAQRIESMKCSLLREEDVQNSVTCFINSM
eukprot:jgi/Antlo1/2527/1038